MKIVHLATSLTGGAGIAARRIVEAQRENGMNSNLIAGNGNKTKLIQNESIYSSKTITVLESKVITYAQSRFIQKGSLLATPVSLSREILSLAEVRDADLLHFHAFYNFFSVSNILEISKIKPVIVTLHDQRFFTGGCHYSFSCTGFQNECRSCPQVRLPFRALPKRELAHNKMASLGNGQIKFISPSRWLADLARKSSLLANHAIHVIENPIPQEIFNQESISTNRASKKIQIGFVSENLNNPYKGLNTLIEALTQGNLWKKFDLNLFGNGNVLAPTNNLTIRRTTFEGGAATGEALSSLDVLVVPSLQDNFPSVVIEALACGVPVIGSHTGGIPEVLIDFGMDTFEAGNISHLQSILESFKVRVISKDTLDEIRNRFSLRMSALRHKEIYKSFD